METVKIILQDRRHRRLIVCLVLTACYLGFGTVGLPLLEPSGSGGFALSLLCLWGGVGWGLLLLTELLAWGIAVGAALKTEYPYLLARGLMLFSVLVMFYMVQRR